MTQPPSGVSFVIAVVGCVKIDLYANNPPFRLHDHILYKTIEQHINHAISRKNIPLGTEADMFADQRVQNAPKRRGDEVWKAIWQIQSNYAASWCLSWVFDRTASGKGLDGLKTRLKVQERLEAQQNASLRG